MTAVEWLEMEIVKLETKFAIPGNIYQLSEQAKKMEKQQIIDAYEQGDEDSHYLNNRDRMGEGYYNETFNNED